MQTSTIGGRSDTEQKALAVMPWTSPLAVSTVMTVTPVAKRPRAARNSSGVTKFVMRCRSGAKLYPEANIPDLPRSVAVCLGIGRGSRLDHPLRTFVASVLKGRAFRRGVRSRTQPALLIGGCKRAAKEMSAAAVEAPGFSPAKWAAAANGFSHGTHEVGATRAESPHARRRDRRG